MFFVNADGPYGLYSIIMHMTLDHYQQNFSNKSLLGEFKLSSSVSLVLL